MEQLIDKFGRVINYIRISITDRCDFRCVYCMTEKMQFLPKKELLSLEEIHTVARAFTELGVSKIRITGGEPLIRRNAVKLLENLAALPNLKELTLTTNGSQLKTLAPAIKAAGVKRINISLDSLKPDKFEQITRHGDLSTVLAGIEAARQCHFERIKINSVILKNRNHDEIIDLVCFSSERGLDISFIEEMPLGVINEHDRAEAYYSSDHIKRDIEQHYHLMPTTETTSGPSKYYHLTEHNTRIGFISPHSHNFCEQCNRVRLTCQGRLLLCLGQEHSVDLRQVIRTHQNDDEQLKIAIRQSMAIKPKGHEFNLAEQPMIFRHMNMTGG